MKKIIAVIAAAAVITAAAVGYHAGRNEGIRHAIEDSEIVISEFYHEGECTIPKIENGAISWQNFDYLAFIDLDGNSYVHYGYIC